nr:hypothetical protein Iba_chr11eCG9340 [Ipomoea batatas]
MAGSSIRRSKRLRRNASNGVGALEVTLFWGGGWCSGWCIRSGSWVWGAGFGLSDGWGVVPCKYLFNNFVLKNGALCHDFDCNTFTSV